MNVAKVTKKMKELSGHLFWQWAEVESSLEEFTVPAKWGRNAFHLPHWTLNNIDEVVHCCVAVVLCGVKSKSLSVASVLTTLWSWWDGGKQSEGTGGALIGLQIPLPSCKHHTGVAPFFLYINLKMKLWNSKQRTKPTINSQFSISYRKKNLQLFIFYGWRPVLVPESSAVPCLGRRCLGGRRGLLLLLLWHDKRNLPPTLLEELAELNQEVIGRAVIVFLHGGPDANSLVRVILLHCVEKETQVRASIYQLYQILMIKKATFRDLVQSVKLVFLFFFSLNFLLLKNIPDMKASKGRAVSWYPSKTLPFLISSCDFLYFYCPNK